MGRLVSYLFGGVVIAVLSGARDGSALELNKVQGSESGGAVLYVGVRGRFDHQYAGFPTVHFDGIVYRMWYSARDTVQSGPGGIGLAISKDGVRWQRVNGGKPVLKVGSKGAFDAAQVIGPCVLFADGLFHMWYGGMDGTLHNGHVGIERIGLAISKDGIHWERANAGQPVVDIGKPGCYDDIQAAHPCVVREGNAYRMWYSAYSERADHVFCVATSHDGIHWKRENDGKPVTGLKPERVIGPALHVHRGKYYMLFSGSTDVWTIYSATSRDGIHWQMQNGGRPSVPLGNFGTFDSGQMHHPCLLAMPGILRVWYGGNAYEKGTPQTHSWEVLVSGQHWLRIGLAEVELAENATD